MAPYVTPQRDDALEDIEIVPLVASAGRSVIRLNHSARGVNTGRVVAGTEFAQLTQPTGDTYHITINGNVDQALLPPSLAAAAAREDSLDQGAALQQLGQAIAKARVKAGKPLLKKLARETGYSESMLSRVLNGKLAPVRDKLEALAEELDVDTRTFATIWLPLWEAATRKSPQAKPRTSPPPAEPLPAPASAEVPEHFVCPSCKALVRLLDAPGHIEWHMSLNQAQFPTASVSHLRPV